MPGRVTEKREGEYVMLSNKSLAISHLVASEHFIADYVFDKRMKMEVIASDACPKIT